MSEHPSTFVALGVIDQLAERLGEIEITTPTPIQEQAIPPLIEGRDLLGLAQTGTGQNRRLSAAADPENHGAERSGGKK